MTAEQTNIPRLDKDQAVDLGRKLRALKKHLSPEQQAYMGFALASVTNKGSDVQGYDYFTTEYYIGYYDAYGNFWATGEVDYDWNTGGQVEFDY
jgi:hypothetical protein